jgi:hypothetical protein
LSAIGKKDEAIAELKTVLAIDPNNEVALTHLKEMGDARGNK